MTRPWRVRRRLRRVLRRIWIVLLATLVAGPIGFALAMCFTEGDSTTL